VQKGEWVEVGKPVVRIVRLDKLRVEGFIHVRDALPGDIVDRSVKVAVELARGQKREFTGKITFVSPLVQAGGDYRVWADVDNRREQDQWLLRPGLEAEMTLEGR
jgi:macrolide-specific efflux system membrane fusion protein